MIEFTVNKVKVLNALLFLIREANGREYRPSQYDLVKAVFLADRAHLNKYGRPITFDRYVAMNHGPVPSFAYDTLKPSFQWGIFSLPRAPWDLDEVGNVRRYSVSDKEPDLKKLSLTDQRCLADAMGTVISLGFIQIRRLTHEDAAYVAAWRDEDGTYAFPMNMELLLDEPDDSAIDDLRYLAEMTGT